MDEILLNQRTLLYSDYLLTWIEQFLLDKRVQNLSPGTLAFYQEKLNHFAIFCDTQEVKGIKQVDANLVRQYLIWLEQQGHNPGGIHAHYRALKTFIYWWEREEEPESWRNPFARVKPPKVGVEPLEPAEASSIEAILKVCGNDYTGLRDKSIIYALIDSGVRAAELIAIDLEDLELQTGAILVRHGKGRKPRTVYLGKKSKRAVRAWLRVRGMEAGALWQTKNGDRLTYWGLREIIRRRSKQANIKPPSLHSFRRLFALSMLRNGADIYTLQKLMGHSDLTVLRRYLAQTEGDLQEAHRRSSPVDNSSW